MRSWQTAMPGTEGCRQRLGVTEDARRVDVRRDRIQCHFVVTVRAIAERGGGTEAMIGLGERRHQFRAGQRAMPGRVDSWLLIRMTHRALQIRAGGHHGYRELVVTVRARAEYAF